MDRKYVNCLGRWAECVRLSAKSVKVKTCFLKVNVSQFHFCCASPPLTSPTNWHLRELHESKLIPSAAAAGSGSALRMEGRNITYLPWMCLTYFSLFRWCFWFRDINDSIVKKRARESVIFSDDGNDYFAAEATTKTDRTGQPTIPWLLLLILMVVLCWSAEWTDGRTVIVENDKKFGNEDGMTLAGQSSQ